MVVALFVFPVAAELAPGAELVPGTGLEFRGDEDLALEPLEGAFVAPLSFAVEGLDCTVAGACGCAGCSVLSGVAFCVS